MEFKVSSVWGNQNTGDEGLLNSSRNNYAAISMGKPVNNEVWVKSDCS